MIIIYLELCIGRQGFVEPNISGPIEDDKDSPDSVK